MANGLMFNDCFGAFYIKKTYKTIHCHVLHVRPENRVKNLGRSVFPKYVDVETLSKALKGREKSQKIIVTQRCLIM